jgi:probable F420-dependent oxidoreductase
MRISAGLPTGMEGLTYPIPFSTPASLTRIALHAEQLGYDSVWGNDHMTTQHYVRAEFPTPPRFWEPLVTYAYLAAVTTRLRFGTGVLVLPMRRDIVVTAKQIATLDHFSGGRLEVGVGIGAYREEFAALQPETRTKRGAIVDEGVQALRQLFTSRVASFTGQYYQFHDVELFPKPLQPHLPLYISGNHPNNLRRTVLWADGWLPAGLHIDRLRHDVVRLRAMAEQAGRDWRHIEIAPQYIVRLARSREQAIAEFQGSQMYKHLTSLRTSTLKGQGALQHEDINLIGTPAQVVEQALALRDAGVTHLLGLYFAANTVEDLCDQMQVFAEEVMPQLR